VFQVLRDFLEAGGKVDPDVTEELLAHLGVVGGGVPVRIAPDLLFLFENPDLEPLAGQIDRGHQPGGSGADYQCFFLFQVEIRSLIPTLSLS
jgi:hypothetical protein